MSYYEDEWGGYERGRQGPRGGPAVRYVERDRDARLDFLDPRYGQPQQSSTALYRTRSVGHSPAPNVQVYNYTTQRQSPSDSGRSPSRGRGRSPGHLRDDELLDEMNDLRRDLRRASSHARSPPRIGGYRDASPGPAYYQNLQMEHFQRDAEERLRWEREQGYRRAELQRLRDRIARDDEDSRMRSAEEQMRWRVERERLKAEAKRQQEKLEEEELREKVLWEKETADRKAKEEKNRAVKDWEAKQREEEEERKDTAKRAVEEYHRKQREAKEKEEEMKLRFKLEEQREKEEEKQREKEWEIKQAQKKAKKEADEKEEKKKLEDEMHRRLAKFGFQENQIEAMLDDEKAAALRAGAAPSNALALVGGKKPTYIKIHSDHISIETLRYYHIPYQLDPVSSRPSYKATVSTRSSPHLPHLLRNIIAI
jgi:hypothetical protein